MLCAGGLGEAPGFRATPARSGAYILQSSFTIVPAKFFSWSTFTRRHSLVLSCLESKTQVHRLHGPRSGKVLIQLPRWPWAEGDSATPPAPGGMCMSGDISYCHGWVEGGRYWHLAGGDQGCCSTAHGAQRSPRDKE